MNLISSETFRKPCDPAQMEGSFRGLEIGQACCERDAGEPSADRLILEAERMFEERRDRVWRVWQNVIRRSGRVVRLVREFEGGPCLLEHYECRATDWLLRNGKLEISAFLPRGVAYPNPNGTVLQIAIPSLSFFVRLEMSGETLFHYCYRLGVPVSRMPVGRIQFEYAKTSHERFLENLELDIC